MYVAIDPATGEQLRVHPLDDVQGVEEKIAAVHLAWSEWAALDFSGRAERLNRLARLLDGRSEACARLMAEEMGKPITQARAEVNKCAWLCRHVAKHGADALRPQTVHLDDKAVGHIEFAPLGLIFGVMPWNFPFWQVFRFAVPTLFAGNGILFKHASNVPGCAVAIEELFFAAHLPFAHLFITHEDCESVIADSRIQGVSLTGSRAAGSKIAALAGKHLKKSVMELGGTDPYLVLEDADPALAAEKCVAGRLLNSGQTCIAAKRWIVVDKVYDAFREHALAVLHKAVVGNPMHEDTTVGPMARADLREALDAQVLASVEAGAELVLGGSPMEGPGFYYPVTLLENVWPEMPAFDEELFGPVAALIRAADEEEAIDLANRSKYGLGAGVFSRDREHAMAVARRIEAGAVAINDFVKSDPRLPFGGIKQSGYGRELSAFGMHEFVNIKTIVRPS